MVFVLDVDQLYNLSRVLEDAWEFAQPTYLHVCCGSGKGIPSGTPIGACSGSMGC